MEVPETPDIPADSKVEVALTLGQMTDTGTTNEYGKVYDLKQEQWFIDNPNGVTMCSFGSKLVSALPNGYDCFEFYLYNPTDTEYRFHLAGNVDDTWTDSTNDVMLAAKTWTKIVIFSEDIQNTAKGDWYMYIQGGNGDGAAQAGWQISTVYAVKA